MGGREFRGRWRSVEEVDIRDGGGLMNGRRYIYDLGFWGHDLACKLGVQERIPGMNCTPSLSLIRKCIFEGPSSKMSMKRLAVCFITTGTSDRSVDCSLRH